MALHFLLFLLESLSCLPLVNGYLTLFLKFCCLHYLLCRLMDPILGRPHSHGWHRFSAPKLPALFGVAAPPLRASCPWGGRRPVLPLPGLLAASWPHQERLARWVSGAAP